MCARLFYVREFLQFVLPIYLYTWPSLVLCVLFLICNHLYNDLTLVGVVCFLLELWYTFRFVFCFVINSTFCFDVVGYLVLTQFSFLHNFFLSSGPNASVRSVQVPLEEVR